MELRRCPADRLAELNEIGEGLLEQCGRFGAEDLRDLLIELGEYRLYDRLEASRPSGEEESCCAGVVCVLADGGWKYLSAGFWQGEKIDESKLWW